MRMEQIRKHQAHLHGITMVIVMETQIMDIVMEPQTMVIVIEIQIIVTVMEYQTLAIAMVTPMAINICIYINMVISIFIHMDIRIIEKKVEQKQLIKVQKHRMLKHY